MTGLLAGTGTPLGFRYQVPSPAARAGINPSSAGAIDSESAQATVGAVQQESTATLPTSTDLIRPAQACDLHQRPSLTAMRLVHTEEVASRGRWAPCRHDTLLSSQPVSGRKVH